MSKQVNLYLQKNDVEKIQNYLLEKKFVFIKDKISEKSSSITTLQLIESDSEWARHLVLTESQIQYMQLENNNLFRIDDSLSESIIFSFYDLRVSIHKVRFYYCPYYFENSEKKYKNPDFEKEVKRFFAWLRRNFEKIPTMPTFYKSPDLVLESYF